MAEYLRLTGPKHCDLLTPIFADFPVENIPAKQQLANVGVPTKLLGSRDIVTVAIVNCCVRRPLFPPQIEEREPLT